MRILEQPALDNTEYLACMAAFCSALGKHLSETENFLARLAGQRKGGHFGWEMGLDKARYGALIVLERWKQLNERFAESLGATGSRAFAESAPAKCEAAAQGLQAAYLSLDELEEYSELLVREASKRLRAVAEMFEEERRAAARAGDAFSPERPALAVIGAPSGPAPAEVFRRTRDSFLTDLNRR